MPTIEAEAVVLRQYSLAEADRIIVFCTREHGRVRAVARGAKRLKSRLAGCLEPLSHIRLQYHMKEGADLGQVRHCEIIHSYLSRTPSPERVYLCQYLGELVHELVQDNNPNPLLFRLFIAVLDAGERGAAAEALVRYFELWALKLSGVLPDYSYCSQCGKCVKEVGFYVWLGVGQVCCAECTGGQGMQIRPAAARLLQLIWTLSPERFASRQLGNDAARDLERLTQALLEWHLERRLKSYGILREMLRNS